MCQFKTVTNVIKLSLSAKHNFKVTVSSLDNNYEQGMKAVLKNNTLGLSFGISWYNFSSILTIRLSLVPLLWVSHFNNSRDLYLTSLCCPKENIPRQFLPSWCWWLWSKWTQVLERHCRKQDMGIKWRDKVCKTFPPGPYFCDSAERARLLAC